MNIYKNKKILVTGGTGFIGTNLVNKLLQLGSNVKVASDDVSKNLNKEVEYIKVDLRNLSECIKVTKNIDIIFHLASFGFGFKANINIQPQILTNNILINTNMLESAYRNNIEKYLFTSSIAVYDKNSEVLDDNLGIRFNNEPEESEKYYAWSKRIGEIQSKSYYDNYKMNITIVRLSNPYGPYDTFDLEKSHVVPAFILKALSPENEFLINGSGKTIRNFIYVEDVVEGMLLLLEKYSVCDPVNLCSDENLSIYELARIVLKICGKEDKKIKFDLDKPEGVIKRLPLTNKIKNIIGFTPKTKIKEGLEKTLSWYKNVLGK